MARLLNIPRSIIQTNSQHNQGFPLIEARETLPANTCTGIATDCSPSLQQSTTVLYKRNNTVLWSSIKYKLCIKKSVVEQYQVATRLCCWSSIKKSVVEQYQVATRLCCWSSIKKSVVEQLKSGATFFKNLGYRKYKKTSLRMEPCVANNCEVLLCCISRVNADYHPCVPGC